jgi:hypothetical protein
MINKKKLRSTIQKAKKDLKITTGVDDEGRLCPTLVSLVTGKSYDNSEESKELMKVLDPVLAANKELDRAALNAVLILEQILLGNGKDENRLAAAREILSKKIPSVKITDITSGNKPLSIEFISRMPSVDNEDECHKE